MKNKILFICSILISVMVLFHLFIIGFTCDDQVIIGAFDNGNVNSISKLSLMLYISVLMIFSMIVIIPNYIKEKKVNDNLFMAYLILEIVLNILPYFYK